MRIAIGCDHGAYLLKNKVADHLRKAGYEVVDFGTNGPESCDYPDFAAAAARAVASGECEKGIVLCTTGIGVSITANKVKGIRCALCGDVLSAELTRQHNDSNMLAMGGRIIGVETAKAITKSWLETEFTGGRHQRRIDKISEYEG